MSNSYDPNTAGMFTLAKELYVKGWTDWSSRATRREYWLGGLGIGLLCIPFWVLLFLSFNPEAAMEAAMRNPDSVDPLAIISPLTWILLILMALLLFVPGIGNQVRRLHDIGRSGWWVLLFVVLSQIPFVGMAISIWQLVWYCTDSEPATNKWGASPKYKV